MKLADSFTHYIHKVVQKDFKYIMGNTLLKK